MSTVKRKITYRLYPTNHQAVVMGTVLRLHQQLYNGALEHRIGAYKQHLEAPALSHSVLYEMRCEESKSWH
jgi:hypothetical protein